ncbi:cob(I)yrinic acid a,c-diamide adenosyltransferase [Tepidibacter hydrothermalis]|uniref:Cob(I)yrinic acid a,c-diamide adenosyltransferase n=1 Tax=Tepidibacter hydrothermalis TaxID=3036126 RepID=A0ABY8E7M6_9FIRM|nr:cob(I)yrinic acid a,c-diamide adenosyltransferase [Tepidibacter hydrothermalis]WFD08859.1 cob(I)yrinic acid a,c-diamide adenosyltransferase [Tepidibacter hydrothermalis]
MEQKGYIHVYTGNGKGKTTAALGLSLRAVCAGKKVFFGQFVKGMKYSEVKALEYLPNFEMEQFGLNCFIYNEPNRDDIEVARKGLQRIKDIINSGEYDVVVLDEVNIALYYKLFDVDEVLEILKNRPKNIEVICTGRFAKEELIEIADLVTEMKEVKHYYNEGVMAREGIEC